MVQIAVGSNQFFDAFCHFRPGKGNTFLLRFRFERTSDGDAFCVMFFPIRHTGNRVGSAADAVFVFQKLCIGIRAFLPLELLKNTVLTLMVAAAAAKHIVNGCLW